MKPSTLHLAIAVILALAALGGYFFWYGYVQQLSRDAVSLASDISAKDAARVRAASARSAEADLASQEAFLSSHLVATADIVSFLEGLEKTGRTFGAAVHVASVSDTAKSADGRISLSLSVDGSFDAVMRTVGAIEEGPYAMTVQDLSLNTADGSSWTATGTFLAGTALASTTP